MSRKIQLTVTDEFARWLIAYQRRQGHKSLAAAAVALMAERAQQINDPPTPARSWGGTRQRPAGRDAARAALWDARNEVVELCANFDVPLEHDSYLDLAVKLDEWAELAGGPPGLADEADAALADGDAAE